RGSEGGRAQVLGHRVGAVGHPGGAGELAERQSPCGQPAAHALVCLRMPVNDDPALVAAIQATSPSEAYRMSLDGNHRRITRIASGVARAPSGGIVVHCHAGKDRTGVVVALLLALAGVSDETIAQDYALSGRNLAPLTEQL